MRSGKSGNRKSTNGMITPGVVVLLAIVGVFAVLLMTAALIRGAM